MSETVHRPRSTFQCFPSTQWTVIRRALAAGESEEQRVWLGELAQRYWKPLYAYFRAKGRPPADAEDLVQSLLGRLMTSTEKLPDLDKTPRFRAWLLTCARNHLVDELRRDNPTVRRPVSLDALRAEHGDACEPEGTESPEEAYCDAWKRQLLCHAMEEVRVISEEQQRSDCLQIFLQYYASNLPQKVRWSDLARSYGLPSWKHAARKADWVKRQLGPAICNEIRKHVENDEDVDSELRELLG